MRISREPDGSIVLDQEHYIKDMLKDEGFDTPSKRSTLATGYADLTSVQGDEPTTDKN